MKRLIFILIVGFLAITAIRERYARPARHAPPPPRWHDGPPARDDAAYREWVSAETRGRTRRALAEAGREVRDAYREARGEMADAYREARDEIRRAYREVVAEVGDDEEEEDGQPPLPPPPSGPPVLVEAEGLPVPIVPGTRVTRAEARPPVVATAPVPPMPPVPPVPPSPVCPVAAANCLQKEAANARNFQQVRGDICANDPSARDDARKVLRARVAEWLRPDVPASWTLPDRPVNSMIVGMRVEPLDKDYGRLYIAELTADFSPQHRAELVETYNHALVRHRLLTMGGILAFVLTCLAALSGYIRADEATKGYYTNHLRMVAAAGVGAAGVVVYRMLA